jgi:hypothetical protein
VRIRNLGIFTLFFVLLVLLAAYGLALLRTYVFKPPPSAAIIPIVVASLEAPQYVKGKIVMNTKTDPKNWVTLKIDVNRKDCG